MGKKWAPFPFHLFLCVCRESLLAEMGVSIREDGGTVGVFSPKRVSQQPVFRSPTPPQNPLHKHSHKRAIICFSKCNYTVLNLT